MRDCPLTSEEQKKRLTQARHLNIPGTHRGEPNQYEELRRPISTGRDFVNNQLHNRLPHHHRSQHRWNERSHQKNRSGKEGRWNFPITHSPKKSKKSPQRLARKKSHYSQRSQSCYENRINHPHSTQRHQWCLWKSVVFNWRLLM